MNGETARVLKRYVRSYAPEQYRDAVYRSVRKWWGQLNRQGRAEALVLIQKGRLPISTDMSVVQKGAKPPADKRKGSWRNRLPGLPAVIEEPRVGEGTTLDPANTPRLSS